MKKYESLFRTSALVFLVTVTIVAFYSMSNNRPQARSSQEPAVSRQFARIQIKNQSGSPLAILSAKGSGATSNVPQVELVVVNKATQPILAYTIRYQTVSSHSKGGGMELTNASSVDSLLQPGYTVSKTIGEGTEYSDPIKKIVVSVDFVELIDGSTWGPDEYKSSERLAGQRAGAHQAVEQLKNTLSRNGPFAVVQSVEGGLREIVPPSGHSLEWLNGFDGGVGSIKERLRAAYTKSGAGVIESELRKPFDASDRR
jgi:hypothetical protein